MPGRPSNELPCKGICRRLSAGLDETGYDGLEGAWKAGAPHASVQGVLVFMTARKVAACTCKREYAKGEWTEQLAVYAPWTL